MRSTRRNREAGQMSILMTLLALAVIFVGITLMVIGQASDARGKAQKAADAAALAAAEQAKTSWVSTWLTSLMPPSSPEAEDWLPDPSNYALNSASAAQWAAVNYAGANSNSTLTRYEPQTVGPRAVHIQVETLSEDLEPVGTGDRWLGVPRSTATATAEIRMRPGVTCKRHDVEWGDEDDDEDSTTTPPLDSWNLRCVGPGFGAITARYRASTGFSAEYDALTFGKLFEVRLVG